MATLQRMERENKAWYGQPRIWWFIIILLAGLVYITGIAHESIWFDEAFSYKVASHSPGEILALTAGDNHPPLYYLLLSVVVSIFGNAVWALRFLSVLGAIGLVSLGAGPVRRIFGNRTAFMYAGLFLLLLSLGIALLPRTWLQVAALGLFALANLSTLRNIYTQYFNLPMNQAAEYLQKEIQPGDAIVTSELLSMGPAVYYLPQALHYNTKSLSGDPLEQQLKVPFSPDLRRDQDVDTLVAAHQPFWYVTSSNGLAKDIGTIFYGLPGWEASGEPRTFSQPFSPISVTVTKYVYTGR